MKKRLTKLLSQLTCLRCGYRWWPRPTTGRPKRCPGPTCKSAYWDVPRTR